MNDFAIMSRRQVEFGIYIRNYRRVYNLSQAEFAKLCSLYGKKKITPQSVGFWENFSRVPSEENMNIALNVMHISKDKLN